MEREAERGGPKPGAMCGRADVVDHGSLPFTDFVRFRGLRPVQRTSSGSEDFIRSEDFVRTETLCQCGERWCFGFVLRDADAGDDRERSKSKQGAMTWPGRIPNTRRCP